MILEYKEFLYEEQAQITIPNEWFAQNVGIVKVYGGGLNGNLKEHNPPHFLIIPTDKNKKKFRVKIPLKKLEDMIPDDIIILDDVNINNKNKKEIFNWLKSINKKDKTDYKINISNLKSIAIWWNRLNENDDNVSKLNIEIY